LLRCSPPLSFAPDWLRLIAGLNPLAYAVDAARAIFNDNLGDPSVAKGVVLIGALAALAVLWAGRQFSRAIA
jgi:ABC-2 type transport system permease protein